MPDCDYCSDSFDDEDEYLQHLADAHEGELGSIDQRRVEQAIEADDGPNDALYTGIGVLLALVIGGAVIYTVFVAGGSGGTGELSRTGPAFEDSKQQPTDLGSVHYHGQITVTIDGEQLDFTKDVFQNPRDFPFFHFERGNARWHAHGKGVTLEYALETVYVGVTKDSVTFRGTTYRESDPGVSIQFLVNGESVNPETYVLQPGDEITVTVLTGVTETSPTTGADGTTTGTTTANTTTA